MMPEAERAGGRHFIAPLSVHLRAEQLAALQSLAAADPVHPTASAYTRHLIVSHIKAMEAVAERARLGV